MATFQDRTSVEPAPASRPPDPNNPEALVAFMMKGWRARRPVAVRPVKHAAAHRRRREALSAAFPGEALVIPTGHQKVRANDTHHRFRPGSDFFYLTGNAEPDAVLVLVPRGSSGHSAHLFVEPNPGRASEAFYTDRKRGELWVGPRLGVPESRARYAVDAAHPLAELPGFLTMLGDAPRLLRGLSPALDARWAPEAPPRPLPADWKPRDVHLAEVLSELRLIKDEAEVAELRAVIASTRRGFEDVIRALSHARSEREVEGHFALRARVEGNDVGYGIIAACGAHACVMHWSRNDGALKAGELLLLDAGVEGHQLYTADITRTLPVSGVFSAPQREIYELVWEAQAAALAQVKPGNDFLAPNRAAMRVLAQGLKSLGILKGSVEEALKDEHQFYRRYTLHNVSHMLGLDVHDCAQARQQVYRHGQLKAGMVLTVEPGLYFQPDDETVPRKYRGIGIRIEDDVLVTRRGCTVLSRDIPSRSDEVERWMVAALRASPARRSRRG